MAKQSRLKGTPIALSDPNSYSKIRNHLDSIVTYEKQGIIEKLYLSSEQVFAIILKDHPAEKDQYGEATGHGQGYFNVPEGIDRKKLKLPEVWIQTDIDPSSPNIASNIGKYCSVVIRNGVGVFARINQINARPTIFNPEHLMIARALAPDGDIENPIATAYLLSVNYALEDIQELYRLVFNSADILSVEGEAVHHRGSRTLLPNEAALRASPIMLWMNQQGMKINDCHLPPKFISGK